MSQLRERGAWRSKGPLRRGLLVGAIAGLAGLLLAGCTGTSPAPAPTHSVLPQPKAMSAQQIRSLDVCALIAQSQLSWSLVAVGEVTATRSITSDPAGCAVFIPEQSADDRLPAYAVSLTSWPTARDWAAITAPDRPRLLVDGGVLVSGVVSGAATATVYTDIGVAYRIVALQPTTTDIDRDKELAILRLVARVAAEPPLPTIPWAKGDLLTKDICAAAKAAGLPRSLGLSDPKAGPLVVDSPDARSCSEKRQNAADSPRFQVSSGLADGLDTRGNAETATIAGHSAVQKWDGKTCRLTIAFPGDPALDDRFTDTSSRTTALFMTAERPCSEVAKDADLLIMELDKQS
ncbi:hypothetical protein [Microbacterium sp. 22242]|uniref:hypothetical protein n=1 Tax=Microbacterium sp. 22242 TaxID=3453896 RepID=UPI003F879A49